MGSSRIMCFLLLAAVCMVSVTAHGGTFHGAESTPENKNYIRNKVATCSKWGPVGATTNAANSSATDVTGTSTLWSYRYKNCSDSLSVCAEVQLTFTMDDKPVVGKNFSGWTHVGSCSAPGKKYQLNASITDPEELERTWVWFHDAMTNNSGRIWGQGANDGYLSTAAPNGAKSLVLYDDATEAPIACCDWVLSAAASTNWTAVLPAGVVCEGDDGGHGSHSSHGSGTENTTDHDHDHDHMAMMNMTNTNTSNTRGSSDARALLGSTSLTWVAGLLLILAVLL